MFTIGVGPSSSHTVGPMCAAHAFAESLSESGALDRTARIRVVFYGSLSLTGLGHGTDRATLAGLEGSLPADVDTEYLLTVRERASRDHVLHIAGGHDVRYDDDRDIVFERWKRLAPHPNGMRFQAFDAHGSVVDEQVWYSIGGGFIRRGAIDDPLIPNHVHVSDAADAAYDRGGDRRSGTAAASNTADRRRDPARDASPASGSHADAPADSSYFGSDTPYPFGTCDELIALCRANGMSIAQLVMANETAHRSQQEVHERLAAVWQVMRHCIDAGCNSPRPILPGGLDVPRRAPVMYRRLTANSDVLKRTHRVASALESSDSAWVALFAMAVSEENAGGGRVVTAPTNGSAGIIPAVLEYYWHFVDSADESGVETFLLTAGAIGYLFKRNASISGAEVGCQGEVGVACSMAAAGLAAVMGGTPEQVENAAEIGIEHNLGLTCDPVGGLVQIPCIERNAMAANTAINAVRMAMLGDGSHIVSLDQAIATMKQTGEDMMSKYKETSKGGLAVNVVEC
ncbi:L-serine ammonia-lyase [Bifidobacterium leontopitheci]